MMHEKLTELFTAEAIEARVKELAAQISRDCKGKDMLMVGVLSGSFIFMADLVRSMNILTELSFISVASYSNATATSGEVRLLYDVDKALLGRDVIIVDDIIDSGYTSDFLIKTFQARKAASVKLCTLLSKPSRRQNALEADYVGFEIEDKFAVGYGMDYAGKYRSLPSIHALEFMEE